MTDFDIQRAVLAVTNEVGSAVFGCIFDTAKQEESLFRLKKQSIKDIRQMKPEIILLLNRGESCTVRLIIRKMRILEQKINYAVVEVESKGGVIQYGIDVPDFVKRMHTAPNSKEVYDLLVKGKAREIFMSEINDLCSKALSFLIGRQIVVEYDDGAEPSPLLDALVGDSAVEEEDAPHLG